MAVGPEKIKQLEARMTKLDIVESDLSEKFVLGSGKGGQKQNKTASAVHLAHAPSGVEVKCQRTRSQHLNRYYARCELCDRLEERILGAKNKKQQAREKIRRQKRRRSRRAKAKMLDAKSQQGQKKRLRGPIRSSEND